MAGNSNVASKTMALKTQANELIKSHTAYDGGERPSAIYTASAGAAHGAPCTVVTYTYFSATSSLVVGMKEAPSTWDSTWDI